MNPREAALLSAAATLLAHRDYTIEEAVQEALNLEAAIGKEVSAASKRWADDMAAEARRAGAA